jgi:hypothetical protein
MTLRLMVAANLALTIIALCLLIRVVGVTL